MLIKIQKYRRVLKEYPNPTSPQDNCCDIFIYILPDFTNILKYSYFILTTLHVGSYFENFCDHIAKSI